MAGRFRKKDPRANGAIDLTPLLDVIFLFLFVLVLNNASSVRRLKANAAEEARQAEAKQAELSLQIDRLQQEKESLAGQLSEQGELDKRIKQQEEMLAELEGKLQGEAALEKAYLEELRAYEGSVIGRRVKILTISCSYDMNDPSRRSLRLIGPEGALGAVDFDSTKEDNAFSQLESWLKNYIETYGSLSSDKAERIVIILSTNSEQILYRDRLRLERITERFEEEYADVY